MREFPHQLTARVRLAPGGDERAVGGAITVALCGHWEHEGACRWPHLTEVAPAENGVLGVVVRFDCSAGEESEVRDRITAAISTGRLIGPDGVETGWEVVE